MNMSDKALDGRLSTAPDGMPSDIKDSKRSFSVTADDKIELKKQVTLLQAVSIIVGIIIGSGIFVSPVGILQNVRSVGMSCVMWTLCGIFSALCALCFAELGASIPESGGEYTYIRRAFGDFPAFISLWIYFIIISPVSIAAGSLIFATYILRPMYPDCDAPSEGIRLLAALIIALIVITNCLNVNWATKAQVVITASKLIALVMVIIIGFINLGKGEVKNFHNSFDGSDYSAGAIAIAFYSGFWAFGGWNYLNYLTGELIEPHKNLPRAIVISMVIVTAVYLLANVAYFSVLTPREILQSSAVAVTFSEHTINVIAWIMPVLIAISVIGSMNGNSLAMSRLFLTGASNNHLPCFMSMINYKYLTPAPSLLSIMVLTLIMQSFEDIFYLIEMMGFAFATVLCVTFLGLIYLRYKEPNLIRPIKLPLVLPLFLLVVNLVLLVLTIIQKPKESGLTVLLMALGIPLYLLGVSWKRKPRGIQRLFDQTTILVQKILLVVPADVDTASV